MTKPLAQCAYEEYSSLVGGKSFNGEDLLTWDALPEKIQDAWHGAIDEVIFEWRDRYDS